MVRNGNDLSLCIYGGTMYGYIKIINAKRMTHKQKSQRNPNTYHLKINEVWIWRELRVTGDINIS